MPGHSWVVGRRARHNRVLRFRVACLGNAQGIAAIPAAPRTRGERRRGSHAATQRIGLTVFIVIQTVANSSVDRPRYLSFGRRSRPAKPLGTSLMGDDSSPSRRRSVTRRLYGIATRVQRNRSHGRGWRPSTTGGFASVISYRSTRRSLPSGAVGVVFSPWQAVSSWASTRAAQADRNPASRLAVARLVALPAMLKSEGTSKAQLDS